MSELRTDFTDAVWTGSKRFVINENGDGTVSITDVTAYTNKETSFFGANDANALAEAINSAQATADAALPANAESFDGAANTAVSATNDSFQIGNSKILQSSNQCVTIQAEASTTNAITLGVRTTQNNTLEWSLSPYSSNGAWLDLGVGNMRWRNIYAVNGVIQTSDRNAKENFADLTDAHADFVLGLKPTSYTMKDGTSGRTHTGFIAQDVEQLMQEQGFESTDMSVICKSGDTYAMRYDEIIAPIVALCQRMNAKINALEQRVEVLENS